MLSVRKTTLAAVVAGLGLIPGSMAAHADTITTFDATGVTALGATFSGTLTIDTTAGVVTADDLNLSSPDNLAFTATPTVSGTVLPSTFEIQIPATTGPGALQLQLPINSLVGYDGGQMDSLSNGVDGRISEVTDGIDIFTEGTLTATTEGTLTTTPLPATLPLFASGLGVLGFLGWRRKRKARAVTA